MHYKVRKTRKNKYLARLFDYETACCGGILVVNIVSNGVITPFFKMGIGSNLFCMRAFIHQTIFIRQVTFIGQRSPIHQALAVNQVIDL